MYAEIMSMIHCGDPDVEDTDIGLMVSEIKSMSNSEIEDLYRQVTEFGKHIDNLF